MGGSCPGREKVHETIHERQAMMTGSSIWEQVLSRIETKVNRHIFYTWFKPTTFVADDGLLLRVRVPNGLFRDWLTKHYAAVLDEALGEIDRKGTSVSFVTDELTARDSQKPVLDPIAADLPPATLAAVAEAVEPVSDEAPSGSLAPRYSFETFIVGSSNQFAHAACRAVAEAPSRSYNPLFIYGGGGLGKNQPLHPRRAHALKHLTNPHPTQLSSGAVIERKTNSGPPSPGVS